VLRARIVIGRAIFGANNVLFFISLQKLWPQWQCFKERRKENLFPSKIQLHASLVSTVKCTSLVSTPNTRHMWHGRLASCDECASSRDYRPGREGTASAVCCAWMLPPFFGDGGIMGKVCTVHWLECHGPGTDLPKIFELWVLLSLQKIWNLELLWSTPATLGYTAAGVNASALCRICFSESRWKADSAPTSFLVSVCW
jgi:hypothetical protein